MIIRSISQLPENRVISSFLSGNIEMSLPLSSNDSLYVSTKIKYSDLLNNIKDVTTSSIVNDYGLSTSAGDEEDGKINIAKLKQSVDEIKSYDCQFDGIKKFNNWPYVDIDFPSTSSANQPEYDQYGNNYEYILPNVKKVKQMINDNIVFMSTTNSMVSEGNPLPFHASITTNVAVAESLDYTNTIGSGKFYFWQIDDGQRDSSQTIYDPASGSVDGYEEIRDTGNLVVWGWLADYGNPAPQPEFCWVALYAMMKCENGNDTYTDIPISVQPWIRGQNASTLQYVGFNIPVQKGLRIKIKTGFPVNGRTSGFQQQGSMTFLDKWIPNAFFGYVIK